MKKSPANPDFPNVVKHNEAQDSVHVSAIPLSYPLSIFCSAHYFSHTWILYCLAFRFSLVSHHINLQPGSKDPAIFIVWTNLMASVYSLVLPVFIISILVTTVSMRQIWLSLLCRWGTGKTATTSNSALKPGQLGIGVILLSPCGLVIPFVCF